MITVPTESEEQKALFQWAQAHSGLYPELRWMFHIPNEGLRHPATGRRLRAEGLKRGVPDVCLPVARGGFHGLYIEMKRIKGGTLSPEQKKWLDALQNAGYAVYVCKGWEVATDKILRYLNLKERDK